MALRYADVPSLALEVGNVEFRTFPLTRPEIANSKMPGASPGHPAFYR